MIVKFTEALEDKDQLNYSVTLPKHLVARLVDYFVFNTDYNPYFDGKGHFEGIDGVPDEVTAVLKVFLDVQMDEHDWRALLRREAPAVFREMAEEGV